VHSWARSSGDLQQSSEFRTRSQTINVAPVATRGRASNFCDVSCTALTTALIASSSTACPRASLRSVPSSSRSFNSFRSSSTTKTGAPATRSQHLGIFAPIRYVRPRTVIRGGSARFSGATQASNPGYGQHTGMPDDSLSPINACPYGCAMMQSQVDSSSWVAFPGVLNGELRQALC
jgi:hypothetical protein